MRPRFTIVAATAVGGACLAMCWSMAPAAAPSAWVEAPQAAAEAQATGEATYSYVGTKKCKSCHLDTHKSWSKTSMGKAFETLEPGNAAEAKTKFGLDPEKDYTSDPTCLPCHTTGYGEPGGYVSPDPDDRRAVRKSKDFQHVSCESCHGPGSAYVPIFEEIDKSQRSYSVDELYAAGMRKIDENACLNCHNDTGPTFDPDNPFDYEKVMKAEEEKVEHLHERVELELRAE